MTIAHVLLLAAAASNKAVGEESRWMRRTANRRQRADDLLDFIEADDFPPLSSSRLNSQSWDTFNAPSLQIPTVSKIDWSYVDALLDPIQGGNIGAGDRGSRKRSQVDAFHYLISTLLDSAIYSNATSKCNGITIVDAACGAGNLSIPLAGLLSSKRGDVRVLAVDVNEYSLERLNHRAQSMLLSSRFIETCCSDLSDYDYILSRIPSNHKVIVVSLHACGAASDMAMNLAFKRDKSPFVVCPCCTAKSLTKRNDLSNAGNQHANRSASCHRSGASKDIEYPRSRWLQTKLKESNTDKSVQESYSVLAKCADVGLGPQTPAQQRRAQSRSKTVVELDRLLFASEQVGYDVRLMRIHDHNPLVYAKGDLLLGAKSGSVDASVLMNI